MDNNKSMLDGHACIVMCVDHYNPLGLIRSLGEEGIHPIVILISENPSLINKCKYVGTLHQVHTIDDGFNVLINTYGNITPRPFLFSCSDDIEFCLDQKYELLKERFIFFDGGATGQISRYINKHEINKLAKACGFRIPISRVVDKGVIPEDFPYPLITKSIASNVGGWKNDVFICNNEEELKKAYKKIEAPVVLLEEYIDKANELCLDGISINHGADIYMPLQCNYLRFIDKSYGNYMIMKPFDNSQLNNQINSLFKKSGFNGIFSIEFLIDKKGELYFLEVNFRHSGWAYSSTYAGANLPLIWAKSMLSGKLEIPQLPVREVPFKVMNEFSDFREFVRSHKIGFKQWFSEFTHCECPLYYNNKDKKPFYSYLLGIFIRRSGLGAFRQRLIRINNIKQR